MHSINPPHEANLLYYQDSVLHRTRSMSQEGLCIFQLSQRKDGPYEHLTRY